MTIYEMTLKKYTEFDGSKIVVWTNESGTSKVWMECNKQAQVFVYAMRNNKMLLGCWEIGYLGKVSQDHYNMKLGYKLLNKYYLETGYRKWTQDLVQ